MILIYPSYNIHPLKSNPPLPWISSKASSKLLNNGVFFPNPRLSPLPLFSCSKIICTLKRSSPHFFYLNQNLIPLIRLLPYYPQLTLIIPILPLLFLVTPISLIMLLPYYPQLTFIFPIFPLLFLVTPISSILIFDN